MIGERKKTLALSVTAEQKKRLAEMAKTRGTSMSGLMRTIIDSIYEAWPDGPAPERLTKAQMREFLDATAAAAIAEALFGSRPPWWPVCAPLSETVKGMLDELNHREATIIRLHFGFGFSRPYTFREIGELYGVTFERIRQLQGQALRRLRHPRRHRVLRNFMEWQNRREEAREERDAEDQLRKGDT